MNNAFIKIVLSILIGSSISVISLTANALEVKISQTLPYYDMVYNGEYVRIKRIQDQNNHISGGFAKTSRKCPPFCIQPHNVADGVVTVAELELIEFLKNKVSKNKGVLIDARTPSWHARGTIPGSVNIPFTIFSKEQDDRQLREVFKQLGVKRKTIGHQNDIWIDFKIMIGLEKEPNPNWDYSNAKEIMLWCNGMWCGQSPRAIKGLLKQGYPAEKIYYYRGGMQAWKILGLTLAVPTTKK